MIGDGDVEFVGANERYERENEKRNCSELMHVDRSRRKLIRLNSQETVKMSTQWLFDLTGKMSV